MDKKLVYFKYMNNDSNYYVESNLTTNVDEYEVKEIPSNCITVKAENSPWKFYNFKDKKIREQGWKIHISATMENAQEILEVVSKILIERQIAFKHIIDKQTLMNINSKNGDRITSGKFIAIYTPTEEEFFELLNLLYEETKNYENGPYILNDKSWKNSNIYYRYGGFSSIYNEKGELCIRDKSGNLIPDHRKAYYQAPEFVQEFNQFLDSKNNLSEDNEEDKKFEEYEFQGVLRYSNGGGIYLAERKVDKKKVVIKEARPKVGLDGQYRDAIDRLNTEYEALTKLADIEGVVDVIDYFKSWKHLFLVEEYVEGYDLQAWIARNYPFHRISDKKIYLNNVKVIINSLINTVEEMHKKGVGMGDLQPSNILITPDLDLKLIDFESATNKDNIEKAVMQTIGFANDKNKNHKERDWYAIKRILRFCVLPIGPVSELEENLNNYHNHWIEQEFGEDFYSYVRDVEILCDRYLSKTKEREYKFIDDSKKGVTDNINLIIERLRKGILKNLIPEKGLIYGDIRQYESPGGQINVLTGGAGAALALCRTGNVDGKVIDWIENYLIENMYAEEQQGLFIGKAGIATTLYELDYREESLELFNEFFDKLDFGDISLRSGLAGIGLALLSLYLEEYNNEYLEKSEFLAGKINAFISENKSLISKDWESIPIGLIDGWSGISLFYSALYSITKNQAYYYKAKDLIDCDLKNTKEDKNMSVLQTIDERDRLLPYLSGGTIGIGVAIWYLNHVSGQGLYQEELKLIVNLNEFRSTFSGGLFNGAGGFLLLPHIMEDSAKEIEKNIKLAISKLDLFLIHKENHTLFPGNFCYRLSDDLYSGSAGIILALNGILYSNPLYWLPIININSFIKKTKKLKEETLLNN